MRYVVSGFLTAVALAKAVSRTVIVGTLFCFLTIPIAAQQRRGGGPAARPNMLDDSDVTLRPPFSMSPDLVPNPNAPQGRIHRFTMTSADSKIYKGISRDKPGEGVSYERSVAQVCVCGRRAAHRCQRGVPDAA